MTLETYAQAQDSLQTVLWFLISVRFVSEKKFN